MGSGQTIDYPKLQQEAMRGVVRSVLQRVQASGLPGDHHFYISFHTQAPGAIVSKRLREKYPQDMTIVLQHRFWDLFVFDDRFEVKLSFDNIPERLVVPFSAIKVFIDPSAHFALPFDGQIVLEHQARETRHVASVDPVFDHVDEAQLEGARPAPVKKPRPARKPRSDRETAGRPAAAGASQQGGQARAKAETELDDTQPPETSPSAPASEENPKVVSLDQFRKK